MRQVGLNLDLSGLAAIESLSKQRGISLKSVKAGAKVIQSAAKARAPKRKGSGALRQSIGIKGVKGTKGKTLAYAVIGARTKVSKMVRTGRGNKLVKAVPAKYAHLVEKGTRPRAGHPGSKPKPFLRPAFDSNKSRALDAAAEVFGRELQAEIEKQSARLLGKLKG